MAVVDGTKNQYLGIIINQVYDHTAENNKRVEIAKSKNYIPTSKKGNWNI